MMDPLEVLAIGAHPDDAEVGCGGTLILAAGAGLRVGVADLTAGERATRGTAAERRAERHRASDAMGLTVRLSLDLPDTGLGTDPGHRDALVRLIRDVRPTVVLAPYPEDRHPDHAAAGRLVREVSFLAGVPKAGDGDGDAHRPARLYHYMVNQPFAPSFVVDISRVWARKMEAVRAYGSQFGSTEGEPPTDLSGGRFLEVVEASATFHGAMIGVERGEPFSCPGPVPLAFLPGFHDLGTSRERGYRMFL
jgi:bacillithiol biosynthesis deacetylase BshB1